MTTAIFNWANRAYNSVPATMTRAQVDDLYTAGKLTDEEYNTVTGGSE